MDMLSRQNKKNWNNLKQNSYDITKTVIVEDFSLFRRCSEII